MPTVDTPEAFASTLFEYDLHDRRFSHSWEMSSLEKTACQFCGGDTSLALTVLVPLSMGGPDNLDNRVVCCRSCATRRGKSDATDPAFTGGLASPLPADLLERRQRALLGSRNHLTNLWPGVPLPRLEARLGGRFAHPRFRVFASTGGGSRCFVGWLRKHGRPQAYSDGAGILRLGFGATLHQVGEAMVFECPPSSFYEILWTLIEMNALVLPLGEQVVLDGDDWRRCWVDTYSSLADNRRRHGRSQTRRPWPPKTLSTNPATVRSRNRKANKQRKEQTRQQELRMSRALQTAWTNFTNPGHRLFAIAPPQEELDAMYQEHCLLLMDKQSRRRYLQSKLKG